MLGVVHPAQRVVVDDDAADPAVLGEGPCLRLDLLGREDARHRRQQRVTVEQVQVAGQLLDTVDLTASLDLDRDGTGGIVAVEVKRRGEIDGVEQLTRYLDLLNRDPLLAPVAGVFAAQEIKPQARTLAEDRGIRCVVVDYDALRGFDRSDERLF